MTSKKSAEQIISDAFNGQPNFMTPHRIECGFSGHYAWELSGGTGFDGGPLYGVSVVNRYSGEKTDLGKCFHNIESAKDYICELKKLERKGK